MGVFPMTMSLVASFMSAITLLGTPAEVYKNGTQYCLLVLSYPFVMAAAAHIYMPVLYDLGVSTSYEYLEWRFNKACRTLGAACFILQMVSKQTADESKQKADKSKQTADKNKQTADKK